MQYTRFSCGLFMSLLATGTPKPVTDVGRREGAKSGEEEALAGVRPWNFIINMTAGTADLPGDGSALVTWTDMRDIAYFVLYALDLETWPENLGMRGDVQSFRDIVKIAESVQKRRFLIREDSVEVMKQKTGDPGKRLYNQVRVAIMEGWGEQVPRNLNEAFPNVKTVTCEEFVKWWSGVDLPAPSWGEDEKLM